MQDRYNRMESFIKSMATTCNKVDPNYLAMEYFPNDVHYNLTRMNVEKKDRNIDFAENGYFNNWISDFFHLPTKVFVSASKQYFCNFINKEDEYHIGDEHIKIYIPQDADHIEKSAELIFNYLDKRDVAHRSRVGRNARIDDIVIRLENEKDALDLIDFVNENGYISEGMINPNPFAFSYKGVALACDRQLSYNICITDMLTAYIRNRKEKNELDKASLNDFVKYTKNYYYNHFVEKKNLGEVIGDISLIKKSDNSIDTNRLLVNTKNIIDLYLKGLDPNFNIDNYFAEYEARCDANKIKKEALEFQEARLKESENVYNVSPIDNFLFDAVRISMNRYKELDDNNLQDDKYYEKKALFNINEYLKSDKAIYLTRSEDLREEAENFNFREKLIHTLEQNNQNLFVYYNNMKGIKEKADFNYAILQTYEKYQDRYEQGFSELDGTEWCVNAVYNYINNNSTSGFTRDNNARYNLERYSSRETARDMIEKFAGHSLESQKDIENYVQTIINR